MSVDVYLAATIFGYMATVDRREPQTPFSPARPPAGYYQFTNETGETYFLAAVLPYVHTVFYLSASPLSLLSPLLKTFLIWSMAKRA